MIRISRNTDLMIIHDLIFDVIIVIGIGNSSAISTSKIECECSILLKKQLI
jgi:hypothetical protein